MTTSYGPQAPPVAAQLPQGLRPVYYVNGGYCNADGTLVTGALLNGYFMPASGPLAVAATVAAAGESDTGNHLAILTTVTNQPPLAR